jgi:hypothetical protein
MLNVLLSEKVSPYEFDAIILPTCFFFGNNRLWNWFIKDIPTQIPFIVSGQSEHQSFTSKVPQIICCLALLK